MSFLTRLTTANVPPVTIPSGQSIQTFYDFVVITNIRDRGRHAKYALLVWSAYSDNDRPPKLYFYVSRSERDRQTQKVDSDPTLNYQEIALKRPLLIVTNKIPNATIIPPSNDGKQSGSNEDEYVKLDPHIRGYAKRSERASSKQSPVTKHTKKQVNRRSIE